MGGVEAGVWAAIRGTLSGLSDTKKAGKPMAVPACFISVVLLTSRFAVFGDIGLGDGPDDAGRVAANQ